MVQEENSVLLFKTIEEWADQPSAFWWDTHTRIFSNRKVRDNALLKQLFPNG